MVNFRYMLCPITIAIHGPEYLHGKTLYIFGIRIAQWGLRTMIPTHTPEIDALVKEAQDTFFVKPSDNLIELAEQLSIVRIRITRLIAAGFTTLTEVEEYNEKP